MSKPVFNLSPEVADALAAGQPVVAMESSLLAQGIPYPQNVGLVRQISAQARAHGAVPALIAILSGRLHIGLTETELDRMGQIAPDTIHRVSRANFPIVMAKGENGATTIAGTMIGAHLAGIKLVATGAIGGVHVGQPFDVSADLTELARIPVTVVCSGIKPFLDLANTREVLGNQWRDDDRLST